MPSVQHAAWQHEAQSPACLLIDTVRTAFIGRRIVFGGSNATKHTVFRYLFIVVLCEAPRDTVLATFTVSISSRKLRDVASF